MYPKVHIPFECYLASQTVRIIFVYLLRPPHVALLFYIKSTIIKK